MDRGRNVCTSEKFDATGKARVALPRHGGNGEEVKVTNENGVNDAGVSRAISIVSGVRTQPCSKVLQQEGET